MYNRYIPQSDGSYRRSQVAEPQTRPQQRPPCPPPEPCYENRPQPKPDCEHRPPPRSPQRCSRPACLRRGCRRYSRSQPTGRQCGTGNHGFRQNRRKNGCFPYRPGSFCARLVRIHTQQSAGCGCSAAARPTAERYAPQPECDPRCGRTGAGQERNYRSDQPAGRI